MSKARKRLSLPFRVLLILGFVVWACALTYFLLRVAGAWTGRPLPPGLVGFSEAVRASLLYWPLLALAFVPLGWAGWHALHPGEDTTAGGVGADLAAAEEFLGPCLRKFLGAGVEELVFRSSGFDPSHLPNLDAALGAFGQEPGASSRSLGWIPDSVRENPPLIGLVGRRRNGVLDDEGVSLGPVEERSYPIGAERERACLVRGVRLITCGAGKLVALLRQKETYFSDSSPLSLEVVSSSRDAAEALLDYIKRHLERHSVYRGNVLSLDLDRLGRPNSEGDHLGIQFHGFPPVGVDDLILPAETRDLLVRNTLTFVERRAALRRVGKDLRRGLLFHGPPGTGKTYAVRFLSSALPSHTTILAAGENLYHVGAQFRLARILAPSLLVFEDVDLIAEQREAGSSAAHTLNALLNEMDGLKGDSEILVVLTTNRPEVLESALSARPGRIDQAIEFPLPDAECRARLFRVHGRGLEVKLEREEGFIERTDGASPAFIKELFRRAALEAAGLQGTPSEGEAPRLPPGLRVTDRELDAALRDLTVSGGALTKQLLGFGSEPRGGLR